MAARMSAKIHLESYAYLLRNSLSKLESAVNETISWLDASQEASFEEYMRSNRNSRSLRSPSFRSGPLGRAQEGTPESLLRASQSVPQEMHREAPPADGRDGPSVFGG